MRRFLVLLVAVLGLVLLLRLGPCLQADAPEGKPPPDRRDSEPDRGPDRRESAPGDTASPPAEQEPAPPELGAADLPPGPVLRLLYTRGDGGPRQLFLDPAGPRVVAEIVGAGTGFSAHRRLDTGRVLVTEGSKAHTIVTLPGGTRTPVLDGRPLELVATSGSRTVLNALPYGS